VKLGETKFSRNLARFIIGKFWTPVGQGAKPAEEANYVMATLFPGKEGLELFDQKIGSRIERLPGFIGFKGLTERVALITKGTMKNTIATNQIGYYLCAFLCSSLCIL
jgi:hypothetical protein